MSRYRWWTLEGMEHMGTTIAATFGATVIAMGHTATTAFLVAVAFGAPEAAATSRHDSHPHVGTAMRCRRMGRHRYQGRHLRIHTSRLASPTRRSVSDSRPTGDDRPMDDRRIARTPWEGKVNRLHVALMTVRVNRFRTCALVPAIHLYADRRHFDAA